MCCHLHCIFSLCMYLCSSFIHPWSLYPLKSFKNFENKHARTIHFLLNLHDQYMHMAIMLLTNLSHLGTGWLSSESMVALFALACSLHWASHLACIYIIQNHNFMLHVHACAWFQVVLCVKQYLILRLCLTLSFVSQCIIEPSLHQLF